MDVAEVKKFAYAAYRAALNSRTGAISLLDAAITGNFTSATRGNGRIMTVSTATNKSFTYTLPAGFGPKEIGQLAFDAVRLLSALTDENCESSLIAWPKRAAAVRFA
jgi:hypothetical protein